MRQPVDSLAAAEIGDLIMVLQKVDECSRLQPGRPGAAALPLPRIKLPLVQKAALRCRNKLLRRAAMIGIISLVMTGQGHHGGMMKVIVPQSVHSVALRFRRLDQPYVLRFVLRHYDRKATGCALADAICDLRENMNRGSVANVLRRVHPKSIEMKFLNPVSRVGNEKLAHRPGIGPVEIERFAPVRGIAVGKIIRRKIFQVVSCGSGMIVNNVKNDAQAEPMRKIDKGAKIVGAAVESGRSEKIDAVIAPSETAVEIVNRHDFQDGYSQTLQFRQVLTCRRPGAFGRERADMHFVNHLSFYLQSPPVEVMP